MNREDKAGSINWPDIHECSEYANHLFDLLRESLKSSNPALAFMSRTEAVARYVLAMEEDIKENISLCIRKNDSDSLVRLLLKVENCVRSVAKESLPIRPAYLKVMMLVVK